MNGILVRLNLILEDILNCSAWDLIFQIKTRCFEFKFDSEKSSEHKDLEHYIRLAKFINLNNNEAFDDVFKHIMDPVDDVYTENAFIRPNRVSHYSSLIGPSLMGKTQFSFILARVNPVFYFNFSIDGVFDQLIYSNFISFKTELSNILDLDLKTFRESGSTAQSGSEDIFENRNIKLFVVGFIWSLVKYSADFDSSEDWFLYYLKKRSTQYRNMSIFDFYTEIGTKTKYFTVN